MEHKLYHIINFFLYKKKKKNVLILKNVIFIEYNYSSLKIINEKVGQCLF